MPLHFTFALVLFNVTGVQASKVLLTLFALKLGAQPFAVGVLAATSSVLPMLLAWQVGKLADRIGSRWLLLFGAALGAGGMLVPYYTPVLASLYIAAVMNGLFFALCIVPLQNLVGLLSESHNRTRNFNTFSLIVSATGFMGSLFSGFLIDYSGHAVTCLYLALTLVIPVVMLGVWGRILPIGSHDDHPMGSIRDILFGSGLWRVLATSSLVVTGMDMFQLFMPIYGYGIGLSASVIGVLLSMVSIAAVVVRVILQWLLARLSEGRILAYSFLIAAVSLMIVPFFQSAVVLGVVSFLFGLGMGCGQPITMMLTFSNSPEGRSGEVLGLRLSINYVTRIIIPVLFGSIGSVFGTFTVFGVNALMLASGGVLSKLSAIGSATPRR